MGCWCRVNSRSQLYRPSGRRVTAEIQIETPQGRKKFLDIFRRWRVGLRRHWRLRWARLERLQDDIFGVLKRVALETLIDKGLNFGFGDPNRHGGGLLLHYDPSTDGKTAR